MRHELALGWLTHYAVGIAFAGLLVVMVGHGWLPRRRCCRRWSGRGHRGISVLRDAARHGVSGVAHAGAAAELPAQLSQSRGVPGQTLFLSTSVIAPLF